MNNKKVTKYKRSLVFAGGGFRLGMYLGMFAACEETGFKPDVLIATCGSSVSLGIINSFENNEKRMEYLKSEEFFNFIKSFSLTKESKLYRIGIDSLLRKYNKKYAHKIINVFDKYMVNIPQDITNFITSINPGFNNSIPSIILGTKLLFTRNDAGKKRGNKKIFQEIYMTDSKTALLLKDIKSPIGNSKWPHSAVDPKTEVKTDFPLIQAARISLTDMFYMSPVKFRNDFYMGGMINLMPLEMAKEISEEVIFEFKNEYELSIEESAVRNVLGYSANARMRDVHDQYADYWIDTSDATTYLKGHYITTRLNFLKCTAELSIPRKYDDYKIDIDLQWKYGYERTIEALSKEKKNDKSYFRNITRHNTSDEFRKNYYRK